MTGRSTAGATAGAIPAATSTAELAERSRTKPDVGPSLAGCLAMLQLRRYEPAVTFCSHALVLDPGNADAYRMRGAARLATHFTTAAVDDFDRAVMIDPKNADGFALRASAYREQGRYALAVEGFSDALRLKPSDGRYWNGRCWTRALAGTELRAALADCRTALKLRPGDANILDSLGFVSLRLKDYRGARQIYSAALALAPAAASALFGRGIAALHLHDAPRARSDIAAAERLDPHVAEPFVQAGLIAPGNSLLRCIPDCPADRPLKHRRLRPDRPASVRLTRN